MLEMGELQVICKRCREGQVRSPVLAFCTAGALSTLREAGAFTPILQVETSSGKAMDSNRSPACLRLTPLLPHIVVSTSACDSLLGPWGSSIAPVFLNSKGFLIEVKYLLALKTNKSRVQLTQII